jgi:16S rRNA processing protein RimM
MQVTVGRIGRPHGIRGEVVVGVRTDEPELRFAVGSQLDTDRADIGSVTVASVRWQSGMLIVRFDGVRDRDAAGELRGTWLRVDSGTLAAPDDPDEFRDHDLIGLSVRTTDGAVIGVVEDVLHPGQDVLVIRPDAQDVAGAPAAGAPAEILVPFVKAIVTEVDIAGGVLVIDPPPGLLNLEEAF